MALGLHWLLGIPVAAVTRVNAALKHVPRDQLEDCGRRDAEDVWRSQDWLLALPRRPDAEPQALRVPRITSAPIQGLGLKAAAFEFAVELQRCQTSCVERGASAGPVLHSRAGVSRTRRRRTRRAATLEFRCRARATGEPEGIQRLRDRLVDHSLDPNPASNAGD